MSDPDDAVADGLRCGVGHEQARQQAWRHWLEGVSRCLLVLDNAAGGAGSMSGLPACSSRFAAGSNLRLACKLGCFCQCCTNSGA